MDVAWLLGGLALALAVAATHAAGVLTPPFMPDTLGAIDHAFKSGGRLWLEPTSQTLPFYRPLPFFLLKLEVAAIGVHVPLMLLGNLLVMASCFAAQHGVGRRLGTALLPSIAVLLVLATDGIWQLPLIWLSDFQAVLALLFGWLAVRALPGAADWPRTALAALCFVAATLCKETGYAFLPALLWLAWTRGTRPLPQAAALLAVGLLCLAWRSTIAGSPVPVGAELAGFERLALYGYNVAANFFGILYRPAFTSIGAINPAPLSTRGDLVFAALALLALLAAVARPRAAAPLVLVMLGNALVAFTEYRARNHMPGFAAVGVLAAIGFTVIAQGRHWIAWIGGAVCGVVFLVGVARTVSAYDANAAYNLAEYHRLGDVPGPDLRIELLTVVRSHCAERPRWCVVDRAALRDAGLL